MKKYALTDMDIKVLIGAAANEAIEEFMEEKPEEEQEELMNL